MLFKKKSTLCSAAFVLICSMMIPVANAQQSASTHPAAAMAGVTSPIIEPNAVINTTESTKSRGFRVNYTQAFPVDSKPAARQKPVSDSQPGIQKSSSFAAIQHHSTSVSQSQPSNTNDGSYKSNSNSHSVVADQQAQSRQSDLYWLSRIIEAEAGGEPMQTKLAVGSVIINRVHSSEFPDTIHDVIFQRDSGYYEFSPVENGHIYNTPSNDAIHAAESVLYQHVNIVPSALVFYNSSQTAAGSWVRQRSVIQDIGHLTFAR